MTKFVNFSTIKGMTETKKFKKVMVGRQNVYISLERAAVLLMLRTTDLEDYFGVTHDHLQHKQQFLFEP